MEVSLMKRLLMAVGVSLVLCLAVFAPADAAQDPKVVICHIPPGNPANAHEIEVSSNAVPAHLAHGDTLGLCGGDDPGDDPGDIPGGDI
jgi:hypothetical protein